MSQKFEYMLHELDIRYTNEMLEQFQKYYDILIEWNKVMNLTGITEYDEVISKHFIDSLSIVKAIDMNQISNLIDIGTGAGFPGIPIKIVFPHVKVTLLDSLNKRVKFLDAVIEEVEIKDINAVHGRAEELAKQKNYREKYELCVSRAVANLASLSEYCLPFVNVGGNFISYKSGDIEDELNTSKNAIKILGGKIIEVNKFQLPATDITRSLIIVNKIKKTDSKFPRRAGIPTKEPL